MKIKEKHCFYPPKTEVLLALLHRRGLAKPCKILYDRVGELTMQL